MGWVGDIQNDQARAYTDVGQVPLQGYSLYTPADLAHQFHLRCLLLGTHRVRCSFQVLPPRQLTQCAWRQDQAHHKNPERQ